MPIGYQAVDSQHMMSGAGMPQSGEELGRRLASGSPRATQGSRHTVV